MARRLVNCHVCGDDVQDPIIINAEEESYYLCQYCFRHGRDATLRNQNNLQGLPIQYWEYAGLAMVATVLFLLVAPVVLVIYLLVR